ncbi:hypothetical protein PRIPAC_97749 [Pristionchus pacificus]|uniref:G protein-coupled receptor n=1 Tax=Pristionchus pacificus TaxID=54126 RepID=A0A2A6D1Q3_PRIPA|nr:hypothetical protein PRIPAC_97749 [Pristionchus pacificus]|eukprot:PDM84412.1 G protein-coupled receptor [Pristionchus pacificus]
MDISNFQSADAYGIHSIIIGTTTVVSFFSNSLLIYIVITTKAAEFGSYRYLLCFFAICNITTTIGHASFDWYCHMTLSGFYFFPRYTGSYISGVSWATVFCWMFIITYYQVFLILAFHFVYRFKIVTSLGSSITDNWSRAHWIAAGAHVYIFYVSAFVATVAIEMSPSEETRRDAPPEILADYGVDLADPRTGFIVLAMRRFDGASNSTRWSASSLIAIMNHMILFGGTGAVVVFCMMRTNAAIKSAETLLTPTMRRLHKQLFRALLVQTTIPCVFSYTPLAIILLFGGVTGMSALNGALIIVTVRHITCTSRRDTYLSSVARNGNRINLAGIALGSFGNVLFLMTAIFPSVDALFVLFFIVKFRLAVIRLFRFPCGNATADERRRFEKSD